MATLAPFNATLPSTVGGGASVSVESRYPFEEDATVHVAVPPGFATTAHVRIPGWAVGATVNGATAPNGTLVAVACAAGKTRIAVHLPMAIRVERGWGVLGESAASPVAYDPKKSRTEPVDVPCETSSDWELQGGAALASSRTSGAQDIRSGGPGDVAWLVNRHPIWGLSHNLTELHASLSYAAGYTPPAGVRKLGATVSLHVLDLATKVDLSGALLTWPPLEQYSWDQWRGYSPPLRASVSHLAIANARPLVLALRVVNHERNVQMPLPSLALSLRWSADATDVPPSPVTNVSWSPAADAAVVRRGPLLFALHPSERVRVVRSYEEKLPARPLAVDYEISTDDHWAFALELAPLTEAAASIVAGMRFDPKPSSRWSEARPFSTDEYPFSIVARACALANTTWGYYPGTKITAQPPPSPLNRTAAACDDAGRTVSIRLVPFGGTNVRIAVFPWLLPRAGGPAAAVA